MKRYLLFFCLIIISAAACKKSEKFDTDAQAKLDDAQIIAYLTKENITATKDPSGLYYQIITPGGTEKPTLDSGPYLTYVGTLMSNGTAFDKKDTPWYQPNFYGFIEGWQIGVPKIGRGGRIKLFIPSGLAYKNEDRGTIPANSVLIFDITMTDFNSF